MTEQKIEIPTPTFDQKFRALEIAMNTIAKPVFQDPMDKDEVHERTALYMKNCKEFAGIILLAANNITIPDPN